MRFAAGYHTDVGTTKETNQDSLSIKIVDTPDGMVCFVVVCDGMGGLAKGELASKELICAMSEWFDDTFLYEIERGSFDEDSLINEWNDILQEQNIRLSRYGKKNGFQLGTTITAMLMYKDQYYIVHVGDSRAYRLTDVCIQLTKDQTLVQREVDAGRLDPRKVESDPRRSILLQCVGASPVVEPDFMKGRVTPDSVYMLCSDGFRHHISDMEIINNIGPASVYDEAGISASLRRLTELDMQRRETDNITAVAVRTFEV